MSPILVLTVGVPGSGKTTKARAWVAADPLNRARVNRDDLRDMLFGGWTGLPDHEDAVSIVQRLAVQNLLAVGWSVVCDDTNLRAEHRAELERIAAGLGVPVEVWDLTDVPLAVCIERDLARAAAGGRHVGEQVIRTMHAQLVGPPP